MTTRNTTPEANQTIGTVTRYLGSEHPYLCDQEVRIVAVLHKGNTQPDTDGEIHGYERLESDAEVAQYGGITAADRVEVAPWIAKEGRFSWVTSDPRAQDLEAFAGLARRSAGGAR